jgi:hypothetical protein
MLTLAISYSSKIPRLRHGRPRFEGGGFVFENYYYEAVHDLTLAYRI